MRKAVKKWASIALLLTLLLSFCACSQRAPAASNGSAGSTPANTETGADRLKEQKELNVLYCVSDFPSSLEAYNKEFEEKYGVKVNYSTLGADTYFEKMLIELSSNSDAYDSIYFFSPQFLQYASNSWLTNMDKLIADKSITDDTLLDMGSFMPTGLEAGKYEGTTYALPVGMFTVLLYYRTDLFEAAGLKGPPDTWEDFEKYAKILHKDGVAGMAMRGARSTGGSEGSIWHWPMMLYAMGGDFVKDFPGDMTPVLNTPEAIKSVEYFTNLLQNYSIKSATVCNYEDITVAVQQGDVAMWIDGAPIVKQYNHAEKSKSYGKIGVAPVPKGPSGRISTLNAHFLGIPANAKNKELAWAYTQWSLSYDMLVKLSVEGTFPVPARTNVYDDPAFMDKNNVLDGKWLSVMRETLSEFTHYPYRPLTPEWPEVADIVSGEISNVMAGQITAAEAMEKANKAVAEVYKEAGYIN